MIQIYHTHKSLRYDEAWLYCACLYDDGYSDWRLPANAEVNLWDEHTIDKYVPLWLSDDKPYTYRRNATYNSIPVRD